LTIKNQSDIFIPPEFSEYAQKLHRDHYVVDAHLDLAGEILLRHQAGESEVIRNHYLGHFRAAGLNLVMSTIYVDDVALPEMGLKNALLQVTALDRDLISVADEVMLVRNLGDLITAQNQEKIAILLYIEGLDFIGTDLELLDIFYELGVRGASLTWSRRNLLANGCCRAREHKAIAGGLSDAGFAALQKLEQLSCFVDVSHLNDDGFIDIAKAVRKPFIATHSNARAVYDSYRNLTDEQITEICRRGGLIGINACSLITGSQKHGNHLEMLSRHIEYIAGLVGSPYIGYGFDLCDSYGLAEPRLDFTPESQDCLRNHSEMPLVTAALLSRGMPEAEVIGIIGGNMRRYLIAVHGKP
jgi:membrane dipeptidase